MLQNISGTYDLYSKYTCNMSATRVSFVCVCVCVCGETLNLSDCLTVCVCPSVCLCVCLCLLPRTVWHWTLFPPRMEVNVFLSVCVSLSVCCHACCDAGRGFLHAWRWMCVCVSVCVSLSLWVCSAFQSVTVLTQTFCMLVPEVCRSRASSVCLLNRFNKESRKKGAGCVHLRHQQAPGNGTSGNLTVGKQLRTFYFSKVSECFSVSGLVTVSDRRVNECMSDWMFSSVTDKVTLAHGANKLCVPAWRNVSSGSSVHSPLVLECCLAWWVLSVWSVLIFQWIFLIVFVMQRVAMTQRKRLSHTQSSSHSRVSAFIYQVRDFISPVCGMLQFDCY